MAMVDVVNYEGCEEVFVGAGWAGVYAFYRRILDDRDRGPKCCLFEQSWRIGGRTYSVRINNTVQDDSAGEFVLDVGAYRYSPDMHLPGDLISNDLELTTECYQKDCPNAKSDFPSPFLFNYTAPLRRLVDPITRLPNGYVTPLNRMIEIAKGHGGRVFTSTALTKFEIEEEDDGTRSTVHLTFHNSNRDETIHIKDTSLLILNLPRNKLFDISGVEESLETNVAKTLKCLVFDTPSDLFSEPLTDRPEDITTLEKAYLYYEDAWWRTVLNMYEGEWPLPASFLTHPGKDGLRFNLRWHDGPMKCDNNGARGRQCHGLLEVYYSVSNETFYSSLAPDLDEPLGSIWYATEDDRYAAKILSRVHAGLMDILSELLDSKGVQSSGIAPPVGLIVGVWNRPTLNAPLGQGYTAPTKVLYDPSISGPPSRVCGVPDLTTKLYRDTVLQPWAKSSNLPNVFLVNNDWVCMDVRYYYGDWAEESLLQAERAMFLLGTLRPAWLDKTYYQEKVASLVSVNYAGHGGLASRTPSLTLIPALFLLSTSIAISCSMVYKRAMSKKKHYTALP